MLREERAVSVRYDAAADVLSIDAGATLPSSGRVEVGLLLDAGGHLVGVDVGEEPSRVVVMLGRHEDVDRVSRVTAEVVGSRVNVPRARGAARANERNPYVR